MKEPNPVIFTIILTMDPITETFPSFKCVTEIIKSFSIISGILPLNGK